MKKYYEIYLSYKEGIIAGKWKSGEKLPSKRIASLADNVSVITVEKAYSLLEEEGYIEARQKRGYFVMPLGAIQSASSAHGKKLNLLPEPEENCARDFEYSLWFKSVRKAISDQSGKLFIKAPGKGCPVLRNVIAEYLYKYRSTVAQPENIIIGSGAEQLYENVVKILGRDKVFGTEDPCYGTIRTIYEGEGARVIALALGKDGIKSSELTSKRFDALHVTPYRSYPSLITTSVAKKYEYVALARKKNIFLIEDDYAGEFAPPGQPIDTLYSLDNQRVIYINTFSATLSPSMRLGYMILPDCLLAEYDKKLGHTSCSVPVLDQYALAEFISGGNFVRHLNRVRKTRSHRQKQFSSAIVKPARAKGIAAEREFPDLPRL